MDSGTLRPVEQAAKILPHFRSDLEAFLLNGYVISTPTVFAMGRLTQKADTLPDPWEPWPEGTDFFAWCIVGPLSEVLTYLPSKPQWVGYFRQNRGWNRNRWVKTIYFRTRTR